MDLTGLNAAVDTWEQLCRLTNCEAAFAAFEQMMASSCWPALPAAGPPPSAAVAGAPAPNLPAGYKVDAAPPGNLDAVLMGSLRPLLYLRPMTAGSAAESLASARAAPSRTWWPIPVVAYTRQTPALRVKTDTP